jgi:hypothetical protein
MYYYKWTDVLSAFQTKYTARASLETRMRRLFMAVKNDFE